MTGLSDQQQLKRNYPAADRLAMAVSKCVTHHICDCHQIMLTAARTDADRYRAALERIAAATGYSGAALSRHARVTLGADDA